MMLVAHADLFAREGDRQVLVQSSRPALAGLEGVPRSYVDRMLWRLALQNAETFTEEGLTRVLNIFPRNNVAITDPLFMFLFTSQTATSTPAKTATGGAAPSGWTEASGGGYARVSTAGTNWPLPAASGAGVRTTMAGTGMSFPESTGAFSGAVNGFGFATAAASAGGDTTIFFANFADGNNITVNAAGYTIRVAAFWHYDV